ncbi:MAG: hypothetical protein V7L20_05170 [Nostoc sp.]|uniref:hypothetical protein n=1 Tax=Nostoc sp. TaxID=1180 RepID=UPI002FF692D3
MALHQSQLTDTGWKKPLKSNCNTAVANLQEAVLMGGNRKTPPTALPPESARAIAWTKALLHTA